MAHLELGTTAAYGLISDTNERYLTEHIVTAKNLIPGTKYFYRIYVEDRLGNKDFSGYTDQFFTTLPGNEEPMATSPQTQPETPASMIHLAPEEKVKELLEYRAELLLALIALYREQGFHFTAKLGSGSRGEEVSALQTILAKDPAIYPEGLITGYFGLLTRAAVIRFQEKYREEILKPIGLALGTGYVGPKTMAKLNELLRAE